MVKVHRYTWYRWHTWYTWYTGDGKGRTLRQEIAASCCVLSVIWFLRPAKIMFTMMRMLTMGPKVIMMFTMRMLIHNDPAFYMTVYRNNHC